MSEDYISHIDRLLDFLENRASEVLQEYDSYEYDIAEYGIANISFRLAQFAERREYNFGKQRGLDYAARILENLEENITDLSKLFIFEREESDEGIRTKLKWKSSSEIDAKVQKDIQALKLLQQVHVLQGRQNTTQENRVDNITSSNPLAQALIKSEYTRTFSIDFQLLNSYYKLARDVVQTIGEGSNVDPDVANRMSEVTNLFSQVDSLRIEDIREIARHENSTLVFYSLISNGTISRQYFDNTNPFYEDDDILPAEQLYIWVVEPSGNISFVDQSFRLNNSQESFRNSVPSTRQTCRHSEDLDNCRSVLIAGVDEGVRGVRRSLGVSDHTIQDSQQATEFASEFIAQRQDHDEDLNNLYQLLIEPIEDLLPTDPQRKVVFIPEGSLNFIPFAALKGSVDQKYLVEKHTIVIAPNIRTLLLSIKRYGEQRYQDSSYQNRKALIVGNPTPMPDLLEPLPGAEEEAHAIADLLNENGFDVKRRIGKKAKKNRVIKNMEDGAEIIHLATHGIINIDNDQSNSRRGVFDSTEASGSIALAGDYLDAAEIFNINLPYTDLVVLSACNTGVGPLVPGGVVGLPFSFNAAGVPSVLMSLWAIPDEQTAELMTSFYKYWLDGRDKAQALRLAMIDMIQEYPSSPKYWAAFTLVGSAE